MKPIPAPSSQDETSTDSNPSSASDLLKSPSYSKSNRRSPQAAANRAYPWLLAISTAVAVVFGLLYIKKPVVIAGVDQQAGDEEALTETQPGGSKKQPALLPATGNLPGEKAVSKDASSGNPGPLTTAPIHSRYEETNMRVQHILNATSEDGHISRIDLEVPVLYQSRNLRWSPAEVARAEELMVRLMDYQDKSRQLRSEGEQLLIDWNVLIGKSIPASRLRADSPSIPENQQSALILSGPADTSTRDAIAIDPEEDKP